MGGFAQRRTGSRLFWIRSRIQRLATLLIKRRRQNQFCLQKVDSIRRTEDTDICIVREDNRSNKSWAITVCKSGGVLVGFDLQKTESL